MDFNSTPPRETPATERPASVAKWKAQRTVRNNQVVESPRRLQCGVMLFRPWDIWILQALQVQKTVRRSNERRHSRSWSRSGVLVRPQFDQNATGDESEAGPPSSQQSFKSGGCARQATRRRDDIATGNRASKADRDLLVKRKDEGETVGEHNELMTRVPQRTVRRMDTVQLTVVKSEADYFEAEVPVCSAGFGVFLDRVHLQWSVPWDVWLMADIFLYGKNVPWPAPMNGVGAKENE